jgi:hypothetical protein
MGDRNCQEVFLGFKFKGEWFWFIEGLLVLRKSAEGFLAPGAAQLNGILGLQ